MKKSHMNSYKRTFITNEIARQHGRCRAIIEPKAGQKMHNPGRRLDRDGWDEVEIIRKDGSKITYPADHPAVADEKRPGCFNYDVWLPELT